MGKVIAIANQKGGVGKTTTTINLGACMAHLGKKVLILDMDPQGNTTSGLGIDRDKLDSTIYDVLIGQASLKNAIYMTDMDGLFISPSGQQLVGAEVELVEEDEREFRLHNALNEVSADFDFIFIDCPPSLGLITINSLVAAQTVLIPIQCEYYALEGLSYLTNTIRQIRKVLNTTLDIEGVLLTMYDSRTNLSIQVVEEVKRCFPQKVYKTVIPRNVRLSEAPSYGQPIIMYDPSSKGAKCYLQLAEELLENNK